MVFYFTLQTSLLRSLKPTERVVKHMEKLDKEPDDEAENERKKQEAKELELDAFGFWGHYQYPK